MPAGFTSTDAAVAYLHLVAAEVDNPSIDYKQTIRGAKWNSHPDRGGNAADFQRVTAAEQYLKQSGALA